MGYALGDKFRIRFAIKETAAGDPASATYQLFYSKNGGAWTIIGTAAADAPLRAKDSDNLTDNSATTQQISSGTFTAGVVKDATVGAVLDLGRSGLTEFEWCVEINAAASSPFAEGDVVQLRVQIGATPLQVYTHTAEFTVAASGPVYQPRDAETFHDFR